MARKPLNIDDLPPDVPVDKYGFPLETPIGEPEPADIATLETMLGQHTHITGHFYARPLKARQQKNLLRIIQGVSGETAQPLDVADKQTEALQQLLAIEDGERFRDATADEIDDAFSIEEQTAILQEHFGMRQVEGQGGGPK